MDKLIYTYGVFAICFNEDKVLLAKRRDRDMWNLPGGRVEKGEGLVDALKREIKEETGAEIQNIISSRSYLNNEKMDLVVAFLVNLFPFEFVPNPEAEQIQYFDISALPENLYFSHKQRILDAWEDKQKLNNKVDYNQ